jgi:hypothetical protein
MSDIIERLRERAPDLADEVIAHVTELNERMQNQHTIMDKAASIMVEATVSEDGIDAEAADACVDLIRGMFGEVGKTTIEHYQGLLYAKVGQLAGIPPDDEFDIMAELEKLGEAAAASKRAGAYLGWAKSVLWREGDEDSNPRITIDTGCGCCGDYQGFPAGTGFTDALDVILAHEAAATAPAAAAA